MENSLNTENLVLGKHTRYYEEYSPSLLQPILRSQGRQSLKLNKFQGFDLWRIYELTYLDSLGIPRTCWGCIKVDAQSDFIVESKSLKLYLGSFTMTKFGSLDEIEKIIKLDLDEVLKTSVSVKLYELETCAFPLSAPEGTLIDKDAVVENISFDYNPSLLKFDGNDKVEEILRSNILRTLCPVTSQPDHASVIISYQGRKIDRNSLFAYLCSLRRHQGFHEQCAELIFSDIKTILKPRNLTVMACFTRRGGIDINPFRCDDINDCKVQILRTFRQ